MDQKTRIKRVSQNGALVIYARLLEAATGRILAQRSTGTDDERLEAAERLRNMDLASFFVWFWTASLSDYILDNIDAEKPLVIAR